MIRDPSPPLPEGVANDDDVEKDRLFAEACQALSNHARGQTPQQTLNRLFRKHLNGRVPELSENPPWLSVENTIVARITRPKLEFARLANFGKETVHDNGNPIVVVVYRGRECLIDGNHRCRLWQKNGDTGDHTAFAFIVCEPAENKPTETRLEA